MIAVVLAAGMSTRFGNCKMSYEVEGKPLLVHVCDALKDLCEVNVVVGYNRDGVEKILPKYINQTLYNADYEKGKETSVRMAVDYSIKREEDLLLSLGDLLYVQKEDYQKLIQKFKNNSVFSKFDNVLGPPCIISNKDLIITEGKELKNGLKNYFHDKGVVELDNASRDIDYLNDLMKRK